MAKKFKTKAYTGTVEGAIEGAKSDIEGLRDEIGEWKDNMEENLSHTDKFAELEECHSALEEVYDKLEEVDLSDLPGNLGDQSVTYNESSPYGRKPMPRWMRLSNAQSAIDAAKSALEAARDEREAAKDDRDEDDFDGTDQIDDLDADVDWETPIDALDEAMSGCDNVSFPGMY